MPDPACSCSCGPRCQSSEQLSQEALGELKEGLQRCWARPQIRSWVTSGHIGGTFWHWAGQNPWRANSPDKPIGQCGTDRPRQGRSGHFPEGGNASSCHMSRERSGGFCLLLSVVWEGVRGAPEERPKKGEKEGEGTRDEERDQTLRIPSPGTPTARRPGS